MILLRQCARCRGYWYFCRRFVNPIANRTDFEFLQLLFFNKLLFEFIFNELELVMKILQMPRRFKTTYRLSSAKLVFRADAEFFPNGSQHDVGGAFNVDFAGVDYQVVI